VATGAENIEASLAAVRLKILTVSSDLSPMYSIDGQTVDMASYMKSLLEMEKQLVDALIVAQGPFEYLINGVP
jgi:hypothetical protein